MGSASKRDLLAALRATLHSHADPSRAPAMQAYMKSALPFLGIAAPQRRLLTAAVVRQHGLADTTTLAETMRELWQHAAWREERYAAMELARVGTHTQLLSMELLPVYEAMIVSGAWWDYCDDISGHAIARLLERFPLEMKPVLRGWARGGDLWLRRAAILCQRRLRAAFDAPLLYELILPSLPPGALADEFFIRKGIGWALRERSYSAPDEVAAFCADYADRLSALTRREALKALARRARRHPFG